jgi:microcompartment protein CcmL/EutN
MEKGKAVAIVECKGLPGALAFLDAALKSANVELLGMELARGEAMVDVKLIGSVGAIKAAVNAGTVVANDVNGIFGAIIFARPSENIEFLFEHNYEIKSLEEQEKERKMNPPKIWKTVPRNKPSYNDEVLKTKEKIDNESEKLEEETRKTEANNNDNDDKKLSDEEQNYTCNLCKDPECPRRKGRPHRECIHYDVLGK